MPEYSIVFARSARRELERLQEPLISRALARIEALASTPRPSGCHKLKSSGNLWRIRVGDYRVLYVINDREEVIDIIAVRHRKDAYR